MRIFGQQSLFQYLMCEPVKVWIGMMIKVLTGLRNFSKDDWQRKMIARINNYNHSCLKEC